MCHTVAQHRNQIKLFHKSGDRLCTSKRVLLRAHMRQKGLCFWCDRPTVLWWEMTTEEWEKVGKLRTATREHMIPKSEGGSDTDDNITCACFRCNSLRGTIPVNQFKWVTDDPKRLNRLITIKQQKRAERNKKRKTKKAAHKLLMAEHSENRKQTTLKRQLHKETTQNYKFIKYAKKMRHNRRRARDITTFTKRLSERQEWDQNHSFIKVAKRMRYLHQGRLREKRAVALALLNYMIWRYPPCQEPVKKCQPKVETLGFVGWGKKLYGKVNLKKVFLKRAPRFCVSQSTT